MTNLISALIGITVHEASHALTSYAQGLPCSKVSIRWNKIAVVCRSGTPAQNAITAAAGPLSNLILGCLTWHASRDFALVNLVFVAISLLPIKGSDGKRIWMAFQSPNRKAAGSPSPQGNQ